MLFVFMLRWAPVDADAVSLTTGTDHR